MAAGPLSLPAEARSMSLARAAVRKNTRRTSLSVGIPRNKFDDISDVASEVGSEVDNGLMHEASFATSTYTARATLNYSRSTQRSSVSSNTSWDTTHSSLPAVVNRLGRVFSSSQETGATNFQIAAGMSFEETFLQEELSPSFQHGRIVVGGAASLLKSRLTKAAFKDTDVCATRQRPCSPKRDGGEAAFEAAQEDMRVGGCRPSSASVSGSQADDGEEPANSLRLPAIPRGNAFRRHRPASNADERYKTN